MKYYSKQHAYEKPDYHSSRTTPERFNFDIGAEYSAAQLQQIFNFAYQGPAGIKETSSGNIVLFSNTGRTPYKQKKAENILYYQGQNTGREIKS